MTDDNPKPVMRRATIDDVLAAYLAWLRGQSGRAAVEFRKKIEKDPNGSAVEAATWWLLHHRLGYLTSAGDVPGKSGPDFDCRRPEGGPILFSVEATAIDPSRLPTASRLQPGGPHITVSVDGECAEIVRQEVVDKVRQAKKREGPVLAAVGTVPTSPTAPLDEGVAAALHPGSSKFRVRRDAEIMDGPESTIEGSTFYVLDESTGDVLDAARRIAGALLLNVYPDRVLVTAAVNPIADFPASKIFPAVPYVESVFDPESDLLTLSWSDDGEHEAEFMFELPADGPKAEG